MFSFLKKEIDYDSEKFYISRLNLVSPQRKIYAEKYKFLTDKIQCVESWLLLKKLLEENYGIHGPLDFSFAENGKPFLKNYPEIRFSLSHCRKACVCAVDKNPVGADIEEIPGKPDDELFRFALSRKEYEAVNESENPCAAFAEFWTKKESYLKLTGEGLSDNLKNVLSQEILNEYIFETTANLEKGYVFTICRKDELKTL